MAISKRHDVNHACTLVKIFKIFQNEVRPYSDYGQAFPCDLVESKLNLK